VGFADLGHEIALIMKPQSDVDMKYIEDVFGSKAKRFHVDLEDLENGKVSGTGFMRVAKVIDGFKPDVIHLHNLESRELVYLRFYLNSKGKNIRTVCTLHDLVTLDRIVGLLESNTLAKQLDMVVAPSQFMLAKLGEIDSTTKNHFSVIYNGVPFRLVGEKSKLKPLKLLFAAELNEHKGGVYLLNAWAKIFRSFPDVKLIIAGEGAALAGGALVAGEAVEGGAALAAGGGAAIAGAGAAAAGLGAAAVAAAPFILGAAAIAGVGFLGYKAYKHYKKGKDAKKAAAAERLKGEGKQPEQAGKPGEPAETRESQAMQAKSDGPTRQTQELTQANKKNVAVRDAKSEAKAPMVNINAPSSSTTSTPPSVSMPTLGPRGSLDLRTFT
jgi:hypothetical protein